MESTPYPPRRRRRRIKKNNTAKYVYHVGGTRIEPQKEVRLNIVINVKTDHN